MTKVNILLDDALLKAADRAARRSKRSRSELIRDAMRAYLQKEEIRAMEERDRIGYAKQPETKEELK